MIRVAVFEARRPARVGGPELLDELGPDGVPEGVSVWIDVEARGADVERFLGEQGLHPLAIEDTLSLGHQPKVEEYDDYLFVIVRGMELNRVSGRPESLKLAAFLGERRLVTCHRSRLRAVDELMGRIQSSAPLPRTGVSHLLYQLTDAVVDAWFPVVETIDAELEDLEGEIFSSPREDQLESILALRRRLTGLRQVMLPHRQVFHHLSTPDSTTYVPPTDAIYFRDIYDQVVRLTDSIDRQREQLASSKDTYLSMINQRINEVMKVLTLFSAILLPLSVITGLYGMNFEHMPGLDHPLGFWGVLAAMALLSGGLLWWFRRRGWF